MSPDPSRLTADVPAALEIRGISVSYGGMRALSDVSLVVPEGAVVALLGPNGAGKSTTLKAASGVIHAQRGQVRRGVIAYRGRGRRAGRGGRRPAGRDKQRDQQRYDLSRPYQGSMLCRRKSPYQEIPLLLAYPALVPQICAPHLLPLSERHAPVAQDHASGL